MKPNTSASPFGLTFAQMRTITADLRTLGAPADPKERNGLIETVADGS